MNFLISFNKKYLIAVMASGLFSFGCLKAERINMDPGSPSGLVGLLLGIAGSASQTSCSNSLWDDANCKWDTATWAP